MGGPIEVKLYVFAHLRDVFQVDRETKVVLSRCHWQSVNELKCEILNILKSNKIREVGADKAEARTVSPGTIMLAINEELIEHHDKINIANTDILALIPPVSGG